MFLYKEYQKQAYEQLIIAQAVIRKNEKDHAEKQELFKSDITSENAGKTAEQGALRRFCLANSAFGFLFAFFFLAAFLPDFGLMAFCGRLGFRRKTRERIKGVSAVIAGQLDRNVGAGISVLS